MKNKLRAQAEELASRPYTIVFEQDKLPNGESYIIARNPELPGCKADGSTSAEAEENLAEARIDYIYALLELGLPVPSGWITLDTQTSNEAAVRLENPINSLRIPFPAKSEQEMNVSKIRTAKP